jgi:hypothetical protein
MKYIITESQDNKMVEKLTNSIKSDGWSRTSKLVGGNENLIKLLGITSPMDFLHLFDDMDVVQSNEYPRLTLFRYNKGNNLMVLDKKNEDILLKPEYLVPPNEKNEIILGEESFYESPENLSRREEKKLKDVTDGIEKALNEKTPEPEKENKESSLMGSIKDLLNKKEIGEESRIAEGEKLKRGSEKILDLLNPSKIGENKEVLLKSIQNIIPTGDLGKTGIMEGFSPDLLKKKTSPEIVKETPELKKLAPKEVKKDEAPKVEEKKEVVKKETTSSSEPAKEIVKEKTTEVNNINSSPAMEYKGVKTEDLNVIVNLLSRMATLLEGPLSIESNESPFRPDSRRF